jgi:hypothetical protein
MKLPEYARAARIRCIAGYVTTRVFATTLALLMATTATKSSAQMAGMAPSPDPRVGLHGGKYDAASAAWNLRLISATQPSDKFRDGINSDLAFTGPYAIQGSFNGYQIWNISTPAAPSLTAAYFCPASQSDVSVYRNLLFVSSENNAARLDCGAEGAKDPVSAARLRGIRIMDISDIAHPKQIVTVQTCRGSHTHSLLVDPRDPDNVYVYVSGSSPVRPSAELPGCVSATPDRDPNSALFRIEVIKVPLAHPEQAAIVSSPRIFNDLTGPKSHGASPEDIIEAKKQADAARARGAFVGMHDGVELVVPDGYAKMLLDSTVAARKGTGAATGADSAAIRTALPDIIKHAFGDPDDPNAPRPGPTQCHDITLYPAIGLAGGACEGYGLLLDIHDPVHPARLAAASDSNFAYWHSATFNNDGTKVLFSDEWGGGGQPKCRVTDKKEWGADALFTIVNRQLHFQSYYKMPAAQTSQENCVAHNGSLIPIPGRDVMIQAWYQGGVSVFDWTDAAHPREIAFFDRGPIDTTHMVLGGSWSVYWYNGVLVSSEIVRGLDILELTPSAFISQNEIDAAKSVHFDYLNPQGQPKLVWPPTFALAWAYADQLARNDGLDAGKLAATQVALRTAEAASGSARRDALTRLASRLDEDAAGAHDSVKVGVLAASVRDLAASYRP